MRLFLFAACCCFVSASFAQTVNYKWFNPAVSSIPVIEGQAWSKELSAPYDRLPARAEKTVPENVWRLSRNSTGLYIKFKTNSSNIRVRYIVKDTGSFAIFHMPATGFSGVDLYALDHNHSWVWAPEKFSFKDTVEFSYSDLQVDTQLDGKDAEFRVYLPLYNTVRWMEIGVPENNSFAPLPVSAEKPIVVYGTSIAQGGCATRTGLAWTAILQRKLGIPLINLGFSGNGKLDKPVVDLVNEIDATLYVLDCLPNMVPSPSNLSEEEVGRRIVDAVNQIRSKHPHTPILLAEQGGENAATMISASYKKNFKTVNGILRRTFDQLVAAGVKNIYTLSSDEINLDMNATVDGVHPNDIGMMSYANAYNKSIRAILHMKK